MTPPEHDSVALAPAPGRGQYDRRQPREARLLEQKARLLSATAFAVARSADATIADVVKVAGVSRNTFYEYFDDLAHARLASVQRAEHRLLTLLRVAEEQTRTPVERWRALSHSFMSWVVAAPADALLCLEGVRSELSTAGRALEAAFSRSLTLVRASGIRTQDQEGLRAVAVAATGEAFARRIIAEQWSNPPPAPRRWDAERDRVERALVDAAGRLLR
jgi:AcrR family transcriptional regulator